MKKFLMAAMAIMLVLGACGAPAEEPAPAEDVPPAEGEPGEPADEVQDEAAAGDVTYDVAAAEATYQQSCAACHGGNLQGGMGPAVGGGAYTYDEIINVIAHGKGTMPKEIVTGEEAENLARWLADQ